jgi:16S rRNA (uracil1498-N3)-methyltransferase
LAEGGAVAERFYCPEPPAEGRATLVGDDARHLALVRRLKVGQVVELFDGRGSAYRAEIREIGRDRVELAVGERLPERTAACELTLATAVPKGERFDWLVEKATELGVARLVPLRTIRSVVDPRAAKLERLRKVVIEASKQCGRSRVMELGRPMEWGEYLEAESAPVRLLAHPGGRPAAAWPRAPRGGRAALVIGPEGGFTEEEVEPAISLGWTAVDLGPTILRVETAGLAASAVVLALATEATS